jgi:hypothetical protein
MDKFQHVDVPVAKLDRASCDFTCARSISKVGLNEVCLSARRPYCANCFFATFLIAANDQYVDA